MSEQEKEAALVFARTKPMEWDAFYARWLKEHPKQEVVSVELATSFEDEEEPKTEKEVEDDKLVEEAEEE